MLAADIRRLAGRYQVRRCGTAGPFDAFDIEYSLCVQTPSHSHEWDSFHLVLRGTVEETYSGVPRVVGPGGLLFYRRGAPHRTRVCQGARILHLPAHGQRLGADVGRGR